MPSPRVGALLCAGAVTLLAAGCASSRFSSQPPPSAAIAGDWKLDWAASDPLPAALARLAAQSRRAAHERRRFQRQQASSAETGDDDGRMHRRRPGQEGGSEEARAEPSDSQDVGSPEPSSAPTQEFLASLPAGEYLRLIVSPSAFTVIAGDSTSQYSPGVESVIESTSGEATQISGWKDGAYVIDTRPQLGPELIQTFELAKHGKLAMQIVIRGEGTDVRFTRLYDRTARVAPLAPPTNN